MNGRRYSEGFKLEAMKQITERDCKASEVADR